MFEVSSNISAVRSLKAPSGFKSRRRALTNLSIKIICFLIIPRNKSFANIQKAMIWLMAFLLLSDRLFIVEKTLFRVRLSIVKIKFSSTNSNNC
jgi:hypothetical protein